MLTVLPKKYEENYFALLEGFMLDVPVTFSSVESINLLRQLEKKERRGEGRSEKRGREKRNKRGDRKAFCKANEEGNGRCVFA